jgi:hypothetical protein
MRWNREFHLEANPAVFRHRSFNSLPGWVLLLAVIWVAKAGFPLRK